MRSLRLIAAIFIASLTGLTLAPAASAAPASTLVESYGTYTYTCAAAGATITDFARVGTSYLALSIPEQLDCGSEGAPGLVDVVGIGTYAFNQTYLESVTIPATVTSIDSYAFSNNRLTTLSLPPGLTSLGIYAFNLNRLTSIGAYPQALTTIPEAAFRDNRLTSLDLSGNTNLTTIASTAFTHNDIEALSLPASLTSIGNLAFASSALGSVQFGGAVASINATAFNTQEWCHYDQNNWKICTKSFAGWFDAATGGNAIDPFPTSIASARTIYGQFADPWTVTFAQGTNGTGSATVAVLDNTSVLPPSTPRWSGHTFEGWFDAASGGDAWDFTTKITSDTTIYGHWTVSSYSVVFDATGGSPTPATQTVTYDNRATAPPEPTRAGSEFDGWFTAANGGGEWNFEVLTITRNTNLYAQWTPIDYTLTFNTNGGSTAPSDQVVAYGTTATAPADPSRTGHTFTGWFDAASDGNAWDFTTDTVTGDTTLYAQWTLNDYTVTFDSTGGSPAPSDQVLAYGTTATAPADPTWTGHTFTGWFDAASDGNKWNFTTDTVTGNTNLYAQWNPIDYTLTFNTNGGSPAPSDQVVAYGTTATAPADPSRTGHTFTGWFDAASDGNAWDFTTDTVTGDTTLYAQWTLNDYTVTFDSTGGSPAPSDQVLAYGTTATAPADPSRTGHTFTGWFDVASDGNKWNFSTDTVSGNTNLYAQWTLNDYIVTIDTTNGDAATAQTVPFGSTPTEPSDPTWIGHTFTGWSTTADGGVGFDFTAPVSGATTAYAQWTLNQYTVEFDSSGGSPAPTGQTVSYGNQATAPDPEPTREHYTFDGWVDSASTPWNFTMSVTEDTPLTAAWTPVTYVVTFDAANQTAPTSANATYPATVSEPAAPFWSGHTFVEWLDDNGAAWDFDSIVTADSTLTAAYIDNVPTVTGPASAAPGDLIAVTGTGFDPHESITVELHSDPVVIATTTADATGAFAASGTIPTDTPAGEHQIVVTAASGTAASLITIAAAPVDTPAPAVAPAAAAAAATVTAADLSATGTNSARTLTLAFGIAIAGAALLAAVRRRGLPHD